MTIELEGKEVFVIYFIPNHCGHEVIKKITTNEDHAKKLVKQIEEEYGHYADYKRMVIET